MLSPFAWWTLVTLAAYHGQNTHVSAAPAPSFDDFFSPRPSYDAEESTVTAFESYPTDVETTSTFGDYFSSTTEDFSTPWETSTRTVDYYSSTLDIYPTTLETSSSYIIDDDQSTSTWPDFYSTSTIPYYPTSTTTANNEDLRSTSSQFDFPTYTVTRTTVTVTPTACVPDYCPECESFIEECDGPDCIEITGIEPAVIKREMGKVATLVGNAFVRPEEELVHVYVATSDAREPFRLPSEYFDIINAKEIQILFPDDEVNLEKYFPKSASKVYVAVHVVPLYGGTLLPLNITAPYPIHYFSPEDAKLIDLTPNNVDLNSPTSLTFDLQGPEYPCQTCVFQSDELTLHSPLIKLTKMAFTDKGYTCEAPAFPTPGNWTLSILNTKPRYAVAQYPDISDYDRPDSFGAISTITVWDEAPELLDAIFTSSGTSIRVTFDKNIRFVDAIASKISQGVSCSEVFDETVQGSNGNGIFSRSGFPSDCIVRQTQEDQLLLQLSGQLTSAVQAILPGQRLVLLGNTIFTKSSPYSRSSSGSIVVRNPTTAPIVSGSVNAPSLIGLCNDYVLDFSSVSGSLGRPWFDVSIAYQVLDSSKTPVSEDSVDDLSVLAKIKNGMPEYSISLEPGNYLFNITFTNFLNGFKSFILPLEKLENNDAPYIVLSSDSGTTDVPVSSMAFLRARAQTVCNVTLPVQYEWSFKSASNSKKITIADEDKKKSVLALPAYTLEPSVSYTFTVAANYAGKSQFAFDITLNTAKEKITANAGASVAVGTTNKLSLSAIIVSDSYATFDASRYDCQWTCTLDNGSNCKNAKTNGDLFSLDNPTTDCTLDLTGQLVAGVQTFSVAVLKAGTQDAFPGTPEPAIWDVKNGKLPLVTLIPSDLNPGYMSSSFSIQSSVDPETLSSPDNTILYQWKSLGSCGGKSYSTINLKKGVTTTTDTNSGSLRFIAEAMKPSMSYCFELEITEVSSNGNSIGYGRIIIKTRDAPSGGTCSIPMSTGDAYLTDFNVICSGWVTDPLSYPLSYYYYVGIEGERSLMAPASSSSSQKFRSAIGSFKTYVKVVDAAGSAVWATSTEVTVNEPQERNSKRLVKRAYRYAVQVALDYIRNNTAIFNSTQDAKSALSAISTTINDIRNKNVADAETAVVQLAALNFLKLVINSGNWVINIENAQLAGNLFQGSVGKVYSVPAKTGEDILSMAQQVLNIFNKTVPTTCYDSPTANRFVTTLDSIVSSLNYTNSYSATVAGSLNYFIDQINGCRIKSLLCSELPYTYSGNSIGSNVAGFDNVKDISSNCQFFAVQSITGNGNKCLSYVCKKVSASGVVADTVFGSDSSISDFSRQLVSFWVVDKNGLGTSPSGSLTGTITVNSTFLNKYGLNGYTVGSQSVDYIPSVVRLRYPNSVNNLTQASLDASVGSLTSYSDSKFTFSANQGGSYALIVKKNSNPVAPTPSVTPTVAPSSSGGASSTNIALIAGCGVAAVVLVSAAVVYGARRHRQKRANSKTTPRDDIEQPPSYPPTTQARNEVQMAPVDIPKLDDRKGGKSSRVTPMPQEEPVPSTSDYKGPLPKSVAPPGYKSIMASRGVKVDYERTPRPKYFLSTLTQTLQKLLAEGTY